jgi:hypothetical protein
MTIPDRLRAATKPITVNDLAELLGCHPLTIYR